MKRRTHVFYGLVADLLIFLKIAQENDIAKKDLIFVPFNQSRFQSLFVNVFRTDFLIPPDSIEGLIIEYEFSEIDTQTIEVSGLFEFQKQWPKQYNPEEKTVLITNTITSHLGSLQIDSRYEGFCLQNVELGRRANKPVSAKIDMDFGVTIVIYDLQAFVDWEHFLVSDRHFAKLLDLNGDEIVYDQKVLGELYAPCAEFLHETQNHLQGMQVSVSIQDKKWVVANSSTETHLNFSQSGFFLKTHNSARLIELGSSKCVRNSELNENTLVVETGMVVDILFKNQLLFRGFVDSDVF